MNTIVTPKPVSSWRSFTHVCQQILNLFPEGTAIESEPVVISAEGEQLVAEPESGLIPALLTLVGPDKKVCEPKWLDRCQFSLGGNRYRIAHVNDPEEHEYGWYILPA